MLNFNSLLVFSEKPETLVDFYKKVFQKEPDMSGGGFSGWKIGASFFAIGPHSNVHGKSQNPERLMFNFETEDVKGEFERIKSLGANVVALPYQPSEMENMEIATLADPDGNYFQLASPMKMS